MRKFKLFMKKSWGWVIAGIIALGMIVLAVFGLSKLESFYRNMTLATMPLQFIMVAINAQIGRAHV